jgi:anaerobic magnesium-protoporphyrin IX monomethyl ester cyclase
LTDDNFGFGKWAECIADNIIQSGISEDLMLFTQARCDDVIRHKDILPKLRKAGFRWILLGIENLNPLILERYNKRITIKETKEAVKLLQRNDIFSQAMFIIGERKDTYESIQNLRDFANDLDPDFSIFAILTPFPGTQLFDEAKRNNWIEDLNWANYDMIHAIMPTETLSRMEIQEELYECYRSFYGSWSRRFRGILSSNELKRRIYLYMTRRGIISQLRTLSQSI